MNIKETIISIIERIAEDPNVPEILQTSDDLTQFNLNSISFIKLVTEIESDLNIEFDDEALEFQNFTSLKVLVEYVEDMVKNSA